MTDLKTKFDRIGYSILMRKLAYAIGSIGILVIIGFTIAIFSINFTISRVHAEDVVANIRLNNIHH